MPKPCNRLVTGFLFPLFAGRWPNCAGYRFRLGPIPASSRVSTDDRFR